MRPALLSVLVFLLACPANGQSLPSKREATVLLQKAIDAANLKADGAAFHLVAKTHYEAYGKAWDGTYELLWATPDRFREEFRLDTLSETVVVLGDKRYVLRNSSGMHLALWRLRGFLDSPLGFLREPDLHVSKVYLSRSAGDGEICVNVDSTAIEREACFHPGSSSIVSAKTILKNNKSGFERTFGDFVALGPKRYPRHQFFHLQAETLEAKIEKLEEVPQFADSVFVAPVRATVFDWCPDPVQQGHLNPRRTSSSPLYLENVAYYVLIGGDGRIVKSVPLVVPSQKTEELMSRWLQNAKFPVEACHGKPIEYEKIYEEHVPVLLSPR